MIKKIKKILRYFINKIYSKFFSPYNYLKDIPRFRKTTIKLLEKDFIISDPLSFYYSYKEIFIDQIYKFKADNESPTILDLGSNHGTSLIYFMKNYPSAKIIGIEADPLIYELLKNNIKEHNFKNITLMNNAVSKSIGPVRFYQDGADGGRTYFMKNKPFTEISTVQLDNLIEGNIDMLKIDIEGNETEVITSCNKLKKVKNIFIEYHSFYNSKQTLDKILNKLTINGFRYLIKTQFCSNSPFTEKRINMSMDLQLNIFAQREKNIK